MQRLLFDSGCRLCTPCAAEAQGRPQPVQVRAAVLPGQPDCTQALTDNTLSQVQGQSCAFRASPPSAGASLPTTACRAAAAPEPATLGAGSPPSGSGGGPRGPPVGLGGDSGPGEPEGEDEDLLSISEV